jgi:O-antigen ligase
MQSNLLDDKSLKESGGRVMANPGSWQSSRFSVAFFWLATFYFVYCARPEDWIPGLRHLPLAKISGVFAVLALLFSVGRTKRAFRDLPREATYLLVMIGLLFPSALLSPVWKGGAFAYSLEFSKVYIIWILTFLLVTDFAKLRRIIFIQAGSVAVISVVSVFIGRSHPRLEGALGGIYSNPNDLAFAIVLSLPFCLAFMLSARGLVRKLGWGVSILTMFTALFLTASRGGFITLLIGGAVCLWHFGVKGRRIYLIFLTAIIGVVLWISAGSILIQRFVAIEGGPNVYGAYGSYEQRRQLIDLALRGMAQHPIFGVGVHNFANYSGLWREVHMTYLQIGVEAGLPVMVLYLLFIWRGFVNLKRLRHTPGLDPKTQIFVGALHSSQVGFVVGACFAPEAYQYFPYFAVAYTSVLVAIQVEKQRAAQESLGGSIRTPLRNPLPVSKRKNELTFVR